MKDRGPLIVKVLTFTMTSIQDSNRRLNKTSIESIYQLQLHHSPSPVQASSIKRSKSGLLTLELPQGVKWNEDE